VLQAQPAHLARLAIVVGRVERVDAVGHRPELLGQVPVRHAGVDRRHLEAAVPEQLTDGLQAHPTVEGLGGQGVAQLVGMDMADAGGLCGAPDHPGDHVPVERPAMVGDEQPADAVVGMVLPACEQLHQPRVQGHHPVVVELAERHA